MGFRLVLALCFIWACAPSLLLLTLLLVLGEAAMARYVSVKRS